MSSYPTRSFRRTALAPGILAGIVLIVGTFLIQNPGAFYWIKIVVAVLGAIVAVYAWQSRQWWWLPFIAAIVVVWNPIWPLTIGPEWVWNGLQYVAAFVFILSGVLIKIANPDAKPAAKSQAKRR